jgi:hypothetical protein
VRKANKKKVRTPTYGSKYTGPAWRKSTKKSKGKTSRYRKKLIFTKRR